MNRMNRIAAMVVMILLVGMVGGRKGEAQDKGTPPLKLEPTQVQGLELKVAQQAAQLAQKDAQAAQDRFQQAMLALKAEADGIIKENKWPEGTRMDYDTLEFSVAPIPAPAPAPTPTPAKKGK